MSDATSSPARRAKVEPSTEAPPSLAAVPAAPAPTPLTQDSAMAAAPSTTTTTVDPAPAISPSLPTPTTPTSNRKRKLLSGASETTDVPSGDVKEETGEADIALAPPPPKRSRTNTPWTPAEEQRLKVMRDAGKSWSEIAKTFPTRTEGSVKKHWYKDMHYAEFAEDESAALLAAIKEYESSKWKVIGQKVGKPAKACEQYAKEHFVGRLFEYGCCVQAMTQKFSL